MLFNLLTVIIIFLISLSRYSLGKSVGVALVVSVLGFIMYFILELFGAFIVSILIWPINTLRGLKRPDIATNPEAMISAMKKRAGKGDNQLPLIGVIATVIALLLFSLMSLSTFTQALFFFCFACFVIVAYLDRVFTHMHHRFIPTAIEALIYFGVGIHLVH